MKKILFVLSVVPCFCFSLQQTKEPSLRIETLHPDGTKTVREMVPNSQVKTERLAPKNTSVSTVPNAPAQRLLASQLEEEAEARRAAKRGQILPEKQRYLALIVAKLQQNWFVDDSMRGKECRINIKLAPDGKVTSTTPLGGDYNLCMSAVRAVENAGNFPMSKDPDVYDALKDITPTLRPELR
jgi:colicin import membrane protein